MSVALGIVAICISLGGLAFSIYSWRRERHDRQRQHAADLRNVVVGVELFVGDDGSVWRLVQSGGTPYSRTQILRFLAWSPGPYVSRFEEASEQAIRAPRPPSTENGWIDQLGLVRELFLVPDRPILLPTRDLRDLTPPSSARGDSPFATVWIEWQTEDDPRVTRAASCEVVPEDTFWGLS